MKAFLTILLLAGLNSVFSQPPGSPKTMPGSDTSTVESDAGKSKSKKQRSDTARKVPKGPLLTK